MNKPHSNSPFRRNVAGLSTGLASALLLSAQVPATAADYYMDVNGAAAGFGDYNIPVNNNTWGTSNAIWTTNPAGTSATSAWAAGNTAIFDMASTTGGNPGVRMVTGPTETPGSVTGISVTNNTGNRRVSFNNGFVLPIDIAVLGNGTVALDGTAAGGITMGNLIQLQGSFVQTGGGTLRFVSAGGNAYVGTATLSGGQYIAERQVTGGLVEGLGVNSNFVITSGSLGLMSGGGTYVIGNLSGAGGSIATGQDNVANGNSTHTLQVNQTANGTYAGSISQSDVTRVFALTKQGSSSLTLTGALSYRGTTTVTAGTLVIDSTTGTGVGAVAVNGGTFSGTGTINTNGNAFTVTGGNLAAGLDGTAGKLTIAGSGAVNISLLSGSGQLKFDLASNTLTSDGVLLTGSGVLNIGTLDFAEFTFTNIGGLAAGTYTLFDTNAAITGSIGVASGAIDGSFNGSLSIVGQDVVLTVTAVPEPGVCALVLVGGMAVLLKRKRHAQI